MSVVCAAIKNGQVAIAADTQTNYGSIKVKSNHIANSKKIFQIKDNFIGIVGWSTMSDAFEHLSKQQPELFQLSDRQEIFNSLLAIHQSLKEKYFVEAKEEDEQPVESTQLNGLIINANGIFEITSYRSVTQFNTFWAAGSGQEIALGAMHSCYELEGFSTKDIVEAGVKAAAEFDDGCNLPVNSEVLSLNSL